MGDGRARSLFPIFRLGWRTLLVDFEIYRSVRIRSDPLTCWFGGGDGRRTEAKRPVANIYPKMAKSIVRCQYVPIRWDPERSADALACEVAMGGGWIRKKCPSPIFTWKWRLLAVDVNIYRSVGSRSGPQVAETRTSEPPYVDSDRIVLKIAPSRRNGREIGGRQIRDIRENNRAEIEK